MWEPLKSGKSLEMKGRPLVSLARKLLFMQLVSDAINCWMSGVSMLCLRELSDTENQKELTKWPVWPTLV